MMHSLLHCCKNHGRRTASNRNHLKVPLQYLSTHPDERVYRTKVNDQLQLPWKIRFSDKLFFIGSCFSENISSRLQEKKFSVKSNPQGILFNPISIERCLTDTILGNNIDASQDLIFDQRSGLYHAWDAHSDFSCSSVQELERSISTSRDDSRQFLANAKVIFITLGTAKVHVLSNHRIVANCHKQPGTMFTNRLLGTEEIVRSLDRTINTLRSHNPEIQVVFTVSPIRHTRDTMMVNSLSKSLLLTGIHQMMASHKEFVSYFPSYEYIIDELRDYRWYGEDLIHLSPAAVDFIFDHFQLKYMDIETRNILKHIGALRKSIYHRSRFPNSPTYQQHLAQCFKEISEMEKILLKQRPGDMAIWENEKKYLTEYVAKDL